MIHRVKHRAFIDKAHFQLGRMDVDVHRLEGHFQMQDTGGELPHHDAALKGLLQGRHSGAALYIPAVDKELLHTPVGPAVGRAADKAPHPHMVQGVVHGHKAPGELPAIHRIDGRLELPVPGGVELLLALPDKPQGDFRVRQGDFVQHTGHGIGLGDVLFQELHPGRGVVKQVPDEEGASLRAAGVVQELFLAPLHHIPGADGFLLGAGQQLHPGHRRNRSQSLSPEAQGADGLQIRLAGHLAGSVAQKGHRHIFPGNARAVVRHPHIGNAAIFDFHRHRRGPGVNGVLHHLFDDGGRPLYHLAGGDEFRHMGVQHVDFSHGFHSFPAAFGLLTA